MNTIMDDSRLTNLNQIKQFLESSQLVGLRLSGAEEKYAFVDQTIDRFGYALLNRKDKIIVLQYLKKITGYKKAQLSRLCQRAVLGKLLKKKYYRKNPSLTYLGVDIKLLEKTDELHLRLSSLATKEIVRREYEVFGHTEYQNISKISSSHINNLRQNPVYKRSWVNATKPRQINIGETRKPENNAIPGSIRVDTVHQRDVYHINAVDEITQWEVVVCVPQLTEKALKPALKILLSQFPFTVFNFHSDKGMEFINKTVAEVLNRLLIKQTKSRSRHCNDNALVETKNGSVIRKNMGYEHIQKDMEIVGEINHFYRNFLNIYLNYHRPCLFVTETKRDNKGREKKIYGQAIVPYEKLKEVARLTKGNFLKLDQSFENLDIIAREKSDNEYAKILREEERRLFNLIEARNS